MKKILMLFLGAVFAAALFTACTGEHTENAVESPSQEVTEMTKADVVDPDPTDNVPAGQYNPATADPLMAANIRNALVHDLLKDDIEFIPAENRRFSYEKVDLNGDGKDEYLVGLQNSFFCGTGGCTFLLLDHEGALVTRFSVSRSPFIVLPNKTNGWHDLAVFSGSAMRKLTFDGTTYPSNPSTLPEVGQTMDSSMRRLLDSDDRPIPTFEF